MKIGARISMLGSLVFALFWILLGAIGIACAIASRRLVRREDGASREA